MFVRVMELDIMYIYISVSSSNLPHCSLAKACKKLVLQMDWIGRICIGQRICLYFSPLWIYICTICLGLGIPTNPGE